MVRRCSLVSLALALSTTVLINSIAAWADGMSRTSTQARQEDTHWLVSYSGVDLAKDSLYIYQGVIVALNRDLGKDGFLLQAYASYNAFRYSSDSVPGGRVHGDVVQA